MSFEALMLHWTRPGAVKEFHIARGWVARSALRREVQALHDALKIEVVEDLPDVEVSLRLAAREEMPWWLRGRRATSVRLHARLQYLGLAIGFESGLAVHANQVRGREEEAWIPDGHHWPVTRQLLVERQGLAEYLRATHPSAEAAWQSVLVDLLEDLGQHRGLQDVVDYMIVHGQRSPGPRTEDPLEIDLSRWTAWSLVRGFVLGADIVAHHATQTNARA